MVDEESPAGSPVDRDREDSASGTADGRGDDSDKDSDVLSEIDEDQFEDYDPSTARIEERPVEIDEDAAKTLKAARRKRGAEPAKKKEGKREKKRSRPTDDDGADGEIIEGKRQRKARTETKKRDSKAATPEENEEDLTPEERRRRALDRAMDAAIKNPSKRRKKKDEVDLEDEIDEHIASLKVRMEEACLADNAAREENRPAVHKLKLLPEVVGLLNRNNVQHAVLDPESNFLQSVKFFLEPLNDGSLPAYNIQREIFAALIRLPIEKEALLSSGIGKVVLFYTKSLRPEVSIKRMAERLLGEWSRPILKRTNDYKKRHIETRELDYDAMKMAQRQAASSQLTLTQRPAMHGPGGSQLSQAEIDRERERERILAPVNTNPNRARIVGLPTSYTVAPVSTFDPTRRGPGGAGGGASGPSFKPIGAGGIDAFKKMTAKGKKKH